MTSPKVIRRARGKATASLELIDAAYDFLEKQNPTSVRAVAYFLFYTGVIPSMDEKYTKKVSRLLTDAREQGLIPWTWLVDEKRAIEGVQTFRDRAEYLQVVRRAYRRDFWAQQPCRVLLISEKGTVRGTVRPVTDEYGVEFLSISGYSGASIVHALAESNDRQPLIALYVGDVDPSGMHMSEVDLPGRLSRYGGHHIHVRRIALLPDDVPGLPSFPAASKVKDSRYKWFVGKYGNRCWELDAMSPNDLRDRVQQSIEEHIEPEAWERCERAQEAEQQSLESLLDKWTAA